MSGTFEYPVTFTGESLDEFREAFPELPPGDEVVLRMRVEPCVHCGAEMARDDIGGFDPKGITEDGVLIGEHICKTCMEEGY